MNFVLFLLLNAVLLLRPEELFPEIAGLRLYLLIIVPCTLLSLPRLLELLSPASLRLRPIAVCVLLFFLATLVSLVSHGRLEEAFFELGPDFAKVVLYYFLLIAIVDTPERFRLFVAALVVLIAGLTIIALAQFHGVVHFPNITPCVQLETDASTGEEFELSRLVSTGIFNDPNDLCLVLGLGILSCLYCATTSRLGTGGLLLWLTPIPLFVFALLETHSKGGLLGVLAGLTGYLYSRFGGAKALPYAAVGAIAVVAMIGGRQGSMGGGTAHERLMFWAEGLSNLFSRPLYIPTGLGPGWFIDDNGLVAHNSFVQAYVELGVLGGGAFLAAFYLTARLLDRLGRGIAAPPWTVAARHYGFAVIIGYAMGCYSLTRIFVVPTYLALGLASVLLEQATNNLPTRFQVSSQWFQRMALLALCGLALLKLMTQALGFAGV